MCVQQRVASTGVVVVEAGDRHPDHVRLDDRAATITRADRSGVGPDKIAPKQAGRESVPISAEAISNNLGDLKAIVFAIAMFWLGAEDSRDQGRSAPGPPIGTQAWADLMERYLCEAHEAIATEVTSG